MKSLYNVRDRPTARILRLARAAPGGVIRWREARDEYVKGSHAAQEEERDARSANGLNKQTFKERTGRHYHMGLSRLLERHFYKVEGTRGYYVLKGVIFNDDRADDSQHLAQFRAAYGLDENGMSISHPRYTIGVIDGRTLSGSFDVAS